MKADVEEFLGNISPCLFSLFYIFLLVFLVYVNSIYTIVGPNTSSYVTASRGKETTAKPSKPTDSKVPALDYVDIPHTQIRKANTYTVTTLYL